MGGTNQKEAYAVDLNDILPKLEDIILYEKLSPKLKISRKEYLVRVKYGATHLKGLLGYNNEAYFIIDYGQPAYDYWFAYYLTISASYKIPLILNRHFQNSGFSIDFLGRLEFFVLKIIDYNVFHDVSDHLKQIVTWLDENNTRLENNSSTYSQTNHISHVYITENNYYQKVQANWTSGNEKEVDSKLESELVILKKQIKITGEKAFIREPFNQLLYIKLKFYCEEGSLEDFRDLLNKGNCKSPVVFHKGVNIKNLTHCFSHFFIMGYISEKKKKISLWMSLNFAVRQSDNSIEFFSPTSTQKMMSVSSNEYDETQFNFVHWDIFRDL